MNRVAEQAILRMEILHTMESYVGPGELDKLSERLALANYADLRSIALRATRAAETFQLLVEPTTVGPTVLSKNADAAETGFTIRRSGYVPYTRRDDHCQDESMSCCERLRALEEALDCSHMDISRKDDAFVGARADHLASRLRRKTDMPAIEDAMLVHSECKRH